MPDVAPYPWGDLPPQRRLARVRKSLQNLAERREMLLAAHHEQMARLEEEERQLREDEAVADKILQKEKSLEIGTAVSREIERLMASGVDIDAFLAESRLADLLGTAVRSGARGRRPSALPEESSDGKVRRRPGRPRRVAVAEEAGASPDLGSRPDDPADHWDGDAGSGVMHDGVAEDAGVAGSVAFTSDPGLSGSDDIDPR